MSIYVAGKLRIASFCRIFLSGPTSVVGIPLRVTSTPPSSPTRANFTNHLLRSRINTTTGAYGSTETSACSFNSAHFKVQPVSLGLKLYTEAKDKILILYRPQSGKDGNPTVLHHPANAAQLRGYREIGASPEKPCDRFVTERGSKSAESVRNLSNSQR